MGVPELFLNQFLCQMTISYNKLIKGEMSKLG